MSTAATNATELGFFRDNDMYSTFEAEQGRKESCIVQHPRTAAARGHQEQPCR